jgi:hypothetical protein
MSDLIFMLLEARLIPLVTAIRVSAHHSDRDCLTLALPDFKVA